MGEGQRERETQNLKLVQALSCQHTARLGAQTHEPWDHDLSQSWMPNQLTHPHAPDGFFILFYFILFYFILFSTFIYFWDRERQSMNGGGAEREGDTESETGSRL